MSRAVPALLPSENPVPPFSLLSPRSLLRHSLKLSKKILDQIGTDCQARVFGTLSVPGWPAYRLLAIDEFLAAGG